MSENNYVESLCRASCDNKVNGVPLVHTGSFDVETRLIFEQQYSNAVDYWLKTHSKIKQQKENK